MPSYFDPEDKRAALFADEYGNNLMRPTYTGSSLYGSPVSPVVGGSGAVPYGSLATQTTLPEASYTSQTLLNYGGRQGYDQGGQFVVLGEPGMPDIDAANPRGMTVREAELAAANYFKPPDREAYSAPDNEKWRFNGYQPYVYAGGNVGFVDDTGKEWMTSLRDETSPLADWKPPDQYDISTKYDEFVGRPVSKIGPSNPRPVNGRQVGREQMWNPQRQAFEDFQLGPAGISFQGTLFGDPVPV